MEKNYLLVLLAAVATCCYATESSDNTAFAAGRSPEELEYVREKIREIEKLVIQKLSDDGRDVPYTIDKQSEFYKNMIMGAIDDILLSVSDVDNWLDAVKGQRGKRGAVHNFKNYPEKKWSMPIKYMIDTTTIVNSTSRGIIRNAIAAWENQTCVTFQEVFSDPGEKYLYFVNMKGGGCKSYIGKASYSKIKEKSVIGYARNRQPVFLEDPGCYVYGGAPMHEIGHALGLYHEAQRLDRDQYIQVYFENIKYGHRSNFIQPSYREIDTQGVPYDLGSLMQYGPLAFSYDIKKHKFVILPYDGEKVWVMGQTSYIGFYDAKAINIAYCPVNPTYAVDCSNHGYPDPHNTFKCKCPAQWTGTKCETLATSSPGCSRAGGVISHTELDIGKTFSLMSPNYMNQDGTFTQGDHCFWKIQAPYKHQIVWWLDNSRVHNNSAVYGMSIGSTGGCMDWLEIRKPSEFRGRRICGFHNSTRHSKIFDPKYSQNQILFIDFRSFEGNLIAKKYPQFRRGFHLKYEIKHISAKDPLAPLYTTRKRNPWLWRTSSTIKPDWNNWYSKINPTKKTYLWDLNYKDETDTTYKPSDELKIIIPVSLISGSMIFLAILIKCVICIRRLKQSDTQRLLREDEFDPYVPPTDIPTVTSNEGNQLNVPQGNILPGPVMSGIYQARMSDDQIKSNGNYNPYAVENYPPPYHIAPTANSSTYVVQGKA